MNRELDIVTLTGAEYDALIADKKRMDWLSQFSNGIGQCSWEDYRFYSGGVFGDLREVCDENMKKQG